MSLKRKRRMARTKSETKKSRPAKAASVPEEQIEHVFAYWKLVMNKADRALLSPERKELIGASIHDYGIEGVMEAIRGCSLSPFHMGANKQKKRYDSLDLILRNADKIEGFLQVAEENPYVEPF
jgi:hypothetical protein